MFGRKKCPRCGRPVKHEWNFCPYCGYNLRAIYRTDFDSIFEEIERSFQEMFNEAVGVDAVVFTKLDVNEKGGNVLSVAYEFKKPILFFGTGQGYDDIKWFEKDWLIKQIVG